MKIDKLSEVLRVTVWNEFRHEKTDQAVKDIYPDGIHTVIAGHLSEQGFSVRTATLDEPEHGLTEAVLAETDVPYLVGTPGPRRGQR